MSFQKKGKDKQYCLLGTGRAISDGGAFELDFLGKKLPSPGVAPNVVTRVFNSDLRRYARKMIRIEYRWGLGRTLIKGSQHR